MILNKRFTFLCVAVAQLVMLAMPTPLLAQSVYRYSIGSISAKQTCNYFLEVDRKSTTVVAPWLLAQQVEWRSRWVKDCYNNFENMRRSLEAALGATGRFTVGNGGYRVNVSIEGISGGTPAPDIPSAGPRGYGFSKASIVTSYSMTITDRTGKVIYGGLSTKSVETGSRIEADGTSAETRLTGDAVYGILQNEIALSIARSIAFRVDPLKVTEVDGDRIRLNYGAPLLKLGSLVEVQGGGLSNTRYAVVSANSGQAIAEADGDFDSSDVSIGTNVNFIEEDDPAANGRRYRRNRLP